MDLKKDLAGQRVLITQAQEMMGPAIARAFRDLDADVIEDNGPVHDPAYPQELIERTGRVDILIVGLGYQSYEGDSTDQAPEEITDEVWQLTFDRIVHPLPRLVRAVLPQMLERKAGKIIVIGSAASQGAITRAATYSAARAAQLSYVQNVGLDLISKNIHVMALAQNFVKTETYWNEEYRNDREIAQQQGQVAALPLGRWIDASESANLVTYLASSYAQCFPGQIFSVTGGWLPR
jgi:NAD(P)-dependent dehydrogenase (short-subunit alcohol dehydrogenase family)